MTSLLFNIIKFGGLTFAFLVLQCLSYQICYFSDWFPLHLVLLSHSFLYARQLPTHSTLFYPPIRTNPDITSSRNPFRTELSFL